MNYTSIEQSKHLLELGLKAETADMHYLNGNISIVPFAVVANTKSKYTHSSKEIIPCWSVETLSKIIPFPILWMECLAGTFLWKCSTTTIEEGKVQEVVGETLLEAVYNMIVWLLENNYIEKGE